MKIIRYAGKGGKIEFAAQSGEGPARIIEGDIFGAWSVSERVAEVDRILAPVVPKTILAVGLNYKAHAEEGGKTLPEFPMIFLKLRTSLQDPGAPIFLPRHLRSDKVDLEGELAVVIGKDAKNVSREEALGHVLGYTCANDVSARDWQKEWGGGQFSRGKSFHTFCPLGPCLVTADELTDPQDLVLRSTLNGKEMQKTSTADMIFDVAALVEFLSGSTLLEAGAVILTGTPSGVGFVRHPPVFLQPGDEVIVEIDKIGALRNPVLEEPV